MTRPQCDEFEDELKEINNNGVEILVVNNLDTRIEFEFMISMYEIIAAASLALPVNWDTTAKFNDLLWWKLKGAPTFPIMTHVARSVLCILAFSSKSESNFLDAGNMLTKKRSGLKPTTVNNFLFV